MDARPDPLNSIAVALKAANDAITEADTKHEKITLRVVILEREVGEVRSRVLAIESIQAQSSERINTIIVSLDRLANKIDGIDRVVTQILDDKKAIDRENRNRTANILYGSLATIAIASTSYIIGALIVPQIVNNPVKPTVVK